MMNLLCGLKDRFWIQNPDLQLETKRMPAPLGAHRSAIATVGRPDRNARQTFVAAPEMAAERRSPELGQSRKFGLRMSAKNEPARGRLDVL